jgi:squalene-hopene/tetraprenyl-beta-curcumene cyclase
MPDTDDTAIVLAALSPHVSARPTRPLLHAIDQAVAWLRDMQNPDGGWPGFTWGLPSKKPGPMFTSDLGVGFDDPRQILNFLFDPPPEYGDPSTEGNTGRVLWGLGACGVDRDDPVACRAIDFLRHQQCENGAWWGRWKTCYVADTATILLGLAAIGEDRQAPYLMRAVDWLLSVQNEDGGWGETPKAYLDPSQAGCGPSMPPLTGYTLLALATLATERSSALDRAAAYLMRAQDDRGGWPNNGWLHTLLPPNIHYVYDFPAQCVPLLALARYRMLGAGAP